MWGEVRAYIDRVGTVPVGSKVWNLGKRGIKGGVGSAAVLSRCLWEGGGGVLDDWEISSLGNCVGGY